MKYISMCGNYNTVQKSKISLRFLGLFYFCIVKCQSRLVLSSVLIVPWSFLCIQQVHVGVNFFISGNFHFSFVSNSLAYITIPKNIKEK